jgi:hypothetical protein
MGSSRPGFAASVGLDGARVALAVAALALAPLAGCTSDLTPSPVPETPSLPASPTPTSEAEVSPRTTSEATLPRLRLPRTTASSAGEYGWEGGPGSRPYAAGMHLVIEEAGRFREATALMFAIGPDCLEAREDQQAVPVRVAGLDGWSIEPYEPVATFGREVGDETTRAYALAVGDRTLCVFITWHATTTDDEREAAVRIPDTLRAEPIGEDRIRIVFTLENGWDTG